MCCCGCTALQDNCGTIIQEFASRVLCLKPKEEIDPGGADKLKAKKQSSLLDVESVRENTACSRHLIFYFCSINLSFKMPCSPFRLTEEHAEGIGQVLRHCSGSCSAGI